MASLLPFPWPTSVNSPSQHLASTHLRSQFLDLLAMLDFTSWMAMIDMPFHVQLALLSRPLRAAAGGLGPSERALVEEGSLVACP